MKKQLLAGLAVGLFVFGVTGIAKAANLIVNGSFEEGNWIDANGYQRLSPNDTALSGWTIGGSGVDWHVGTPNPLQNPLLINPHLEPAQAGSLVVDLNLDGGSTGTISQTFATRAGTTYAVSFYMAGIDFFTNPRTVDVEVGGVSRTFSQTASPQRQLVWGRKSFEFTATGSQATLTFRSPDMTGVWGPLLDSVNVVAAATTDDPATTLITHYYVSILERGPELDGLAYWQGLVAEKQARGEDVKDVFRQMANFFFNSPEYIGRNTTDRQFITNLYLTFFQRTPDEGGYAFWLDQLARGMTRNQAMSGFLYSQEFTDFMERVLEGGSGGENLPPDPGPDGLTTLEGIDSDRDGIRDDIQRLIALDFPGDDFNALRAMLTDTAAAAQQLLTNATNQETVIGQMQNIAAISACLEQSYPNDSQGLWGMLRAGLLNTEERTNAYLTAHQQLAGHTEILSNSGGDVCSLYTTRLSLTTHPLTSANLRLSQLSQKLRTQAAETQCGVKGSYIFYGNGMFNDYPSAVQNLEALKFLLSGNIETVLQPGENLLYGLSYNYDEALIPQVLEVLRQWRSGLLDTFLNSIATSLDTANLYTRQWLLMSLLNRDLPGAIQGFVTGELVEALIEVVNNGTIINQEIQYIVDEDLQRHVEQYSELLGRGKRILVVSHSQGNFYANLAYGLIQQRSPELINGFGVYGVATPATRVAGGGSYTKLRNDLVVGLVPGSLPGNTSNSSNNGDLSGHEFINSYVFGDVSGPKMESEIPAALASLQHPEQTLGDGIITVRLTWGSQPDVDLHVFEPNGAHVYYSSRMGVNGYLDVDDVSSYGPEHYYVGCDTLEQGTYRVGVNYYAGSGQETALININAGDVSRNFTIPLSQAVGSSGNSSPIPVANITVNRDEQTGVYSYQVQGQ